MASNKYIYSDISKTKSNLHDADAILESVWNCLDCTKGERLFNRGFGSNIEQYLFDELSFTTSRLILADLYDALTGWDPRVEILSTTNVELDYENRAYSVTISIRLIGITEPITSTRIFKLKN